MITNNNDHVFRINRQEKIIYTIVENEKGHRMISWSIDTLIENLNYNNEI